jgi:hypothetical protein
VTKLAEAVDWTQRIGYSYPRDLFEPALRATIKGLSDTEVEHCVAEHQRVQADWNRRVEAREFFGMADGATERA